jgi:hypothetical protein
LKQVHDPKNGGCESEVTLSKETVKSQV